MKLELAKSISPKEGDDEGLLTDQIATSIREIWRISRSMTSSTKKDGLGIEQYWILRFLHDSGPQRVKDIAEKLGTTSSPVTISVKRLAGRKLVTRERGSQDERVVTVGLTQRGKQVFESWRKERRQALSSLFDSLNETQRHQLSELLQNVLENIASKSEASLQLRE